MVPSLDPCNIPCAWSRFIRSRWSARILQSRLARPSGPARPGRAGARKLTTIRLSEMMEALESANRHRWKVFQRLAKRYLAGDSKCPRSRLSNDQLELPLPSELFTWASRRCATLLAERKRKRCERERWKAQQQAGNDPSDGVPPLLEGASAAGSAAGRAGRSFSEDEIKI